MYLGVSAIVDFLVCAGLGFAAAACAFVCGYASHVLDRIAPLRLTRALLSVMVFFVFGGALLSIAVVLGQTKSARDPDSILGFAVAAATAAIIGFWGARHVPFKDKREV